MPSYADERLLAWRANSKLIRARSSQMERDVAKFLIGKRVPYSGAGALKGDCEVETEKVGKIFIECKYSAHRNEYKGPGIRIDFRWFDKIHRDAGIMRAKFGALVFKYHGGRFSSYVIISTDVLEKYATRDYLTGAARINAGDKSGISLYKSMVDAAFVGHLDKHEVAVLECNRGTYVFMPISLFKELIHGDADSI